ncbi:hypothetical protein [Microvirga yunnanensis]|uniref:hypothetical protein n=1 Tax=Microvirga yunnanensis TaxID=2953740 RepID=UPI0021C597F0|nr:hypothetical protein [Microvirga sp. HBU67655]
MQATDGFPQAHEDFSLEPTTPRELRGFSDRSIMTCFPEMGSRTVIDRLSIFRLHMPYPRLENGLVPAPFRLADASCALEHEGVLNGRARSDQALREGFRQITPDNAAPLNAGDVR